MKRRVPQRDCFMNTNVHYWLHVVERLKPRCDPSRYPRTLWGHINLNRTRPLALRRCNSGFYVSDWSSFWSSTNQIAEIRVNRLLRATAEIMSDGRSGWNKEGQGIFGPFFSSKGLWLEEVRKLAGGSWQPANFRLLPNSMLSVTLGTQCLTSALDTHASKQTKVKNKIRFDSEERKQKNEEIWSPAVIVG